MQTKLRLTALLECYQDGVSRLHQAIWRNEVVVRHARGFATAARLDSSSRNLPGEPGEPEVAYPRARAPARLAFTGSRRRSWRGAGGAVDAGQTARHPSRTALSRMVVVTWPPPRNHRRPRAAIGRRTS